MLLLSVVYKKSLFKVEEQKYQMDYFVVVLNYNKFKFQKVLSKLVKTFLQTVKNCNKLAYQKIYRS